MFNYEIGEVVEGNWTKWIIVERRFIQAKNREEVSYFIENMKDRDEGYWVSENELQQER